MVNTTAEDQWVICKLGDRAEEIRNLYEPASGEEYPYIGLEHIAQQSLRLNGIGSSTATISTKKAFCAGEILFGSLRPYFRKVARPRFGGVCSTDITVIRAKANTHQVFLYYLIASQEFIDHATNISSGTRMPRASWKVLCDSEWRFPPLPTQHKIASILSAYDDLIENNLRRIRILEEMAENLYREWFVKFRFPGNADARFVDGIPEEWEVKKLRELITIDKGISYKGKYLTDDGLPMVNLKCIPPGGGFKRDGTKPYSGDYKSRHRVQSGDLVFANTDLTQAGNIIGSPGLVPRSGFDGGGIASHHICIVRLEEHSPMNQIFLFHLLQSGGFHEYAKGCASGTTVLGFRADDALNFTFALPTRQLIRLFEQIANDTHELGESLRDSNVSLRLTRDLLLPRLISGELDVSELDITIPEETI